MGDAWRDCSSRAIRVSGALVRSVAAKWIRGLVERITQRGDQRGITLPRFDQAIEVRRGESQPRGLGARGQLLPLRHANSMPTGWSWF